MSPTISSIQKSLANPTFQTAPQTNPTTARSILPPELEKQLGDIFATLPKPADTERMADKIFQGMAKRGVAPDATFKEKFKTHQREVVDLHLGAIAQLKAALESFPKNQAQIEALSEQDTKKLPEQFSPMMQALENSHQASQKVLQKTQDFQKKLDPELARALEEAGLEVGLEEIRKKPKPVQNAFKAGLEMMPQEHRNLFQQKVLNSLQEAPSMIRLKA
jgi:hypothetical protein